MFKNCAVIFSLKRRVSFLPCQSQQDEFLCAGTYTRCSTTVCNTCRKWDYTVLKFEIIYQQFFCHLTLHSAMFECSAILFNHFVVLRVIVYFDQKVFPFEFVFKMEWFPKSISLKSIMVITSDVTFLSKKMCFKILFLRYKFLLRLHVSVGIYEYILTI